MQVFVLATMCTLKRNEATSWTTGQFNQANDFLKFQMWYLSFRLEEIQNHMRNEFWSNFAVVYISYIPNVPRLFLKNLILYFLHTYLTINLMFPLVWSIQKQYWISQEISLMRATVKNKWDLCGLFLLYFLSVTSLASVKKWMDFREWLKMIVT